MSPEQATATAEVVKLVNKERAAAGCQSLRVSPALSLAAQRYADVMAKGGGLSHTGPDGSQPSTRAARVGYQKWVNLGENIARGYPTAADVMQALMRSPGHRANILDCRFKEIGVGVNFGSPDGPWWAQYFGTRDNAASARRPAQ
ncbi:CAP domain-containing protein [Streptomyces sp. NPDC004647]|uniref:CAP domain-containing protein n=1 Tax=Streptomyces sp. NPDC004647 TaxID=3154671 RepID=UPI0033A08E6E